MRHGKRAEIALSFLSENQRRAWEELLRQQGVHTEQVFGFFLREQRALKLLLERVPHSDIRIPLTLISQQQIGSLEAICQYLRDTRALSYAQIAALLQRHPKTVWASCRAADIGTRDKPFSIPADDFSVPLSIIADTKLSVLEAVVVYLRELGYRPFQIAAMLQRDQRVVATVWQRAQRKIAQRTVEEQLAAVLATHGVTLAEFVTHLLAKEQQPVFRWLLVHVRQNKPVQIAELQLLLDRQTTIPLTLISQQQIGSLEAICQYLRDTRALSYAQIAALLQRHPKTVWASCRAADIGTRDKPFSIPADDFSVPLSIIADTKLSVLEAVVVYLRELGYRPFQIAAMLQRDQRVVATVWQRAQHKRRASSDAGMGVAA